MAISLKIIGDLKANFEREIKKFERITPRSTHKSLVDCLYLISLLLYVCFELLIDSFSIQIIQC